MIENQIAIEEYFRLKPLKAAKVSEISEATAAAPVDEDEKINFHIGHPVQDDELSEFYYRLITDGFDSEDTSLPQEFLRNLIVNSSPYAPRGGFSRKHPDQFVAFLKKWFSEGQSEPLQYNFGESSESREVILSSGGPWEALRILFYTMNYFLEKRPAHILTTGLEIPDYLQDFEFLRFYPHMARLDYLREVVPEKPATPYFILLGRIPTEEERRLLRKVCLAAPLFIVELNDALNHLSMAREAGMAQRVLRFLSGHALRPGWKELPLTIMAGNASWISRLETIHFQLKGTPATPEKELLRYLLNESTPSVKEKTGLTQWTSYPDRSNAPFLQNYLWQINRLSDRNADLISKKIDRLTNVGTTVEKHTNRILSRITRPDFLKKSFATLGSDELIPYFLEHAAEKSFQENLKANFLAEFLQHHSEYEAGHCFVVSGSSRTALSLLGFHCGISEVVSPDLSWTYEHGFPQVHIVPLDSEFDLDTKALIKEVERKLEKDPQWKDKGAVILNNPHNATGRVFAEDKVRHLLRRLLEMNVWVIDDLSYQGVAAADTLTGPPSLRQIANDLVRKGYLTGDHVRHLITVHSLSKTDSFAGARLAVLEIIDRQLAGRFERCLQHIKPNIAGILLAYLFYRNRPQRIQAYWTLRNRIMNRRMKMIDLALDELPRERNPFGIKISRPQGSMYPHLIVQNLPDGVSLDWLASGLAVKGIGLIPLSTFARSAQGYDLARKAFRLTLGGRIGTEELKRKTRRVIIDLNRMIAEESARYRPCRLELNVMGTTGSRYFKNAQDFWQHLQKTILTQLQPVWRRQIKDLSGWQSSSWSGKMLNDHIHRRLNGLKDNFFERVELSEALFSQIRSDRRQKVTAALEEEFYKDDLSRRKAYFKHRLFDRTVHPTQMFALPVDLLFNRLFDEYIRDPDDLPSDWHPLVRALVKEFLGINVPIHSAMEGDELVCDLKTLLWSERLAWLNDQNYNRTMLSFWGDWDGSSRPSGQGHRLVSAPLLENIRQMAHILNILLRVDSTIQVDSDLLGELARLDKNILSFQTLLNRITDLTQQLEKRFHGILPLDMRTSRWRSTAVHLHLARDPLKIMWQHNDRLERRMRLLRQQRGQAIDYYFQLNKKLRKTLHALLPRITEHLGDPLLAFSAGLYRDLLKRFALTPRIHQKIILADDPFTIDTTVQNLMDINELAGRYGNPGLIQALQISMSTDPEALIHLDRKIKARREGILRENPQLPLPSIWLVPLFEEPETVDGLENYLNRLYEYALQSRTIGQSAEVRFSEMISEIFIAGSDLSQQVGQPSSTAYYKQARFITWRWLAQKGLIDEVRIKLGSGEPMQRQGGYYDPMSGQKTFRLDRKSKKRMSREVDPAVLQSTEYARSPLSGILSEGDLRTLQSNVFERLRLLKHSERAHIFFHMQCAQEYIRQELLRIGQSLKNTRLRFETQGIQELERLSALMNDEVHQQFNTLVRQNFRRITYGTEHDMVGIHIISYFLSRSMPELRDRPTVRPSKGMGEKEGQEILGRLTETLPLARHGSLLRAIGHNRAQTMLLGVNQLTTGLFRACKEFAQMEEGKALLQNRILPSLPVKEILQSLRLFHDPQLTYVRRIEKAYPAGNSSFLALREDVDSISSCIPLLQKELLRRQGVKTEEFFVGEKFNVQLLPSLRPDLAVILQQDLFNTQTERMIYEVSGQVDEQWLRAVENGLLLPEKIRFWREKIWLLIEKPIFEQVQRFVELAMAIQKLMSRTTEGKTVFSGESTRILRMASGIKNTLKDVGDDTMRRFLLHTVHYLSELPQMKREAPIDIIRALSDVDRIIKIEEQILSSEEQVRLRFYLLQLARVSGENG